MSWNQEERGLHLARVRAVLDRHLRPHAGLQVIGARRCPQQVQRDHRELQMRSPLQQQCLVRGRHGEQLAHQADRLVHQRDEMLASVAGLDDRVTEAAPVEHLVARLCEALLGHDARTGREIEDAPHALTPRFAGRSRLRRA